jgi:hypothetical protein
LREGLFVLAASWTPKSGFQFSRVAGPWAFVHHSTDRSRSVNGLKKLSVVMLSVLALPLVVHTAHAGGQPAAQFAFATSNLDLIKETTGTGGWVTILSAPIKTPSSRVA